MVPNGCSTVCRRTPMASGIRSSLACIASRTRSCFQRLIRFSLSGVHLGLRGQVKASGQMAVMVDIAAAVRSDKPSCQMLAGRAGVMILLSVVDEVLPGEQAALGVARCQCLWHTGQYAGVLACQYLIAVEIAPVGHGGDLLAARGLLRLEGPGCKLVAVVPLINHLVSHDQMVLDVDGDLYVVADGGGAFVARP